MPCNGRVSIVWTNRHRTTSQLTPHWRSRKWYFWDGPRPDFRTAEIAGILTRLKLAWTAQFGVIPGRESIPTKPIVIFTNAKEIMLQARGDSATPTHELICKLVEWVRRFKCVGIRVELHWVPGLVGVSGIAMANALAIDAALLPSAMAEGLATDGFSFPLPNIPDDFCLRRRI